MTENPDNILNDKPKKPTSNNFLFTSNLVTKFNNTFIRQKETEFSP